MTTAELSKPIDAATVERVLIHGDLKQLSPAQKVSYYNAVCESVGLNPLTQPFQYLVLNGKEVLYARRDATEQLRKLHKVSITIAAREVTEDCYVVTARASLPDGRQDENIGAVPIAGLKGEARANALMKAETKAKRRVTLAICGLGMLDETEVESIPDARLVVEAPAGLAVAGSRTVEAEPVRTPSAGNGGDSRQSLPPGAVFITKVKPGFGETQAYLITSAMQPGDDKGFPVYKEQLKTLAEEVCQNGEAVTLEFKTSKKGYDYIVGIKRVAFTVTALPKSEWDERNPPPMDADEIAF